MLAQDPHWRALLQHCKANEACVGEQPPPLEENGQSAEEDEILEMLSHLNLDGGGDDSEEDTEEKEAEGGGLPAQSHNSNRGVDGDWELILADQ